jgi:hypothetical protein
VSVLGANGVWAMLEGSGDAGGLLEMERENVLILLINGYKF